MELNLDRIKNVDIFTYGLVIVALLWILTIASALANILIPLLFIVSFIYLIYWFYRVYIKKQEADVGILAGLCGVMITVFIFSTMQFIFWIALIATVVFVVYLAYNWEKKKKEGCS